MAFNIAIKAMISLAIGFVFWFWAFMVFMVYSFMPISKMANSIIFALVAPVIYLTVSSLILSKLFREKGSRAILINLGISIGAMVFSILIIDGVGRLIQ